MVIKNVVFSIFLIYGIINAMELDDAVNFAFEESDIAVELRDSKIDLSRIEQLIVLRRKLLERKKLDKNRDEEMKKLLHEKDKALIRLKSAEKFYEIFKNKKDAYDNINRKFQIEQSKQADLANKKIRQRKQKEMEKKQLIIARSKQPTIKNPRLLLTGEGSTGVGLGLLHLNEVLTNVPKTRTNTSGIILNYERA